MTTQVNRLAVGGRIDRSRTLTFWFDGRRLTGHPGDTLASALLANDIRIVGRSFKRHRPRGLFAAGSEEPNAMVRVGAGATVIPCIAATQVELYDGLVARSVNTWPSAAFDVAGALDLFAPFMPAGFYYKTFMWPRGAWRFYEHIIRRAAGLGAAPAVPDSERYEQRFEHVDVLVVGAGPAGLAAARAAAHAGARVLIVDEQAEPGGTLLAESQSIDGQASDQWLAHAIATLAAAPRVRLLPRATAYGYYDHNLVAVIERVSDHLPIGERAAHRPRQRLWKVRARQVVLATGAIERPLLFANNDRPGVMLAHAAAHYATRFAVRPGRRAVLYTDNDCAYFALAALQQAGVDIAAVVDLRDAPGSASGALAGSVPVHAGGRIVAAHGRRGVRAVQVSVAGREQRIECDLVCVAGGFNPAAQLFSQSGGRLQFDERIHAFVPTQSANAANAGAAAARCAGACNGTLSLAECLEEGLQAGFAAARAAGFEPPDTLMAPVAAPAPAPAFSPIRLPAGAGKNVFVDLLNDVSAFDLGVAAAEGYSAPEHAKRYTTAGMGVDQGRTGNINALAVLAAASERSIATLAPTTFRPPVVPVAFGALAGRDTGERVVPLRRTPITDWHEHAGAVFEPVGRWRRPMTYLREGERIADAVARECRAARNAVALCDVSTLGKIELTGPDAVRLLNMLYTNEWSTLAVGRCRYGVMLKDDGMVFDDGTTSRLGEHHYFMTTTSGHADAVADWIEEWLQCEWPAWRVFALNVTTQWAAILVNGPRARELLERVGTSIPLARDKCPFMSAQPAQIAGIAARVLRVSFTGELAFEIYVPAGHGLALWEALITAGSDLGITPFGTEALHVLRAEKGFFVVGHDADATVSPLDLGIDALIGHKKADFIGKRSLARTELRRSGRLQFVGITPEESAIVVTEGSPIIETAHAGAVDRPPVPCIGRVTSSYHSPTLGRSIALGLVADGLARVGQSVTIVDRGVARPAVICSPRRFDPEGARLHG